jgi:ComF family protein
MPQWREQLLDLLYPRKCGLCSYFGEQAICPPCFSDFKVLPEARREPSQELDYGVSIYAYEGRAAQAVQRLKYERVTSLAAPMAEILAEAAEQRTLLEVDAVVPVPIHWSRWCQRGFNQSEMLTEKFPPQLLAPKLLKRIRATRPQVSLTPEQRLRNLQGAFSASDEVAGLRVLLIDDVFTSGQTARECAKALKAKGAIEVGILAFAGG